MSCAAIPARGVDGDGDVGGDGDGNDARAAVPPAAVRYHALDWARVTAMFLGVFYHLPIAFMGGAFGFGFGFGTSPKTPIDNWLHSFRMPLFFLISGFFASMMLGKYGPARYLARRWWRIGAPLFLAVFAFAGLRTATTALQPPGPPGFGPPGFGPPATTNPAPPGGFGPFGPPPTGGFGAPGAGPFGAPGANPFGPPAAGPGAPGGGGGGFGPPPFGGFGGPPAAPAGGVAGPPAMIPPFVMPGMPSRVMADRLFGKASWSFNLEHLWFLWYLLVFSTVAPAVAILLSRVVPPSWADRLDGLLRRLIRWNLVAPVLGLAALPALIHARGFAGWSLANPVGFLAPFPDFFVQYYPDTPYYFAYFLAGWWLFRARSGLDDLSRAWLWNLALGVAGFAASQALSDRFAFRPDTRHFEWIRLGSFALYGVGAAFTACGFLGFFQKYSDRPTRVGRYLSDTILWVYLIHLPLIPYLLWWVQPGRGPWWADTLAGMAVVTGVSLALFELVVRPTPLVYVFGPPRPRRQRPEKPAVPDGPAEVSARS